ncbi:hypothetical protein GL325_06680 [Aeromicrobium sp. 636]|uniref:Uncharacterized protein n=1 Tax=Aeromicrobium senzhongii TaxID=2663859 RepID=A0A8I0JZH5_9ACTN|nr:MULTISPECIES: hypothetical protein [Aeromicrobium]MBC9225997.1 hypothetical protein [Aeromicrobium senzhongii]MCQ3998104.1 hypothetical protein [Aeromicrobium sp. 636]
MSPSLTAWSRALLTVLVLLGVGALGLMVFGAALIWKDAHDYAERWDGVAALLGTLAAGAGLVALVVAVGLVRRIRAAQAAADAGRLAVAGGFAVGMATVLLIAGLFISELWGSLVPGTWVPALALAVPAVGTVAAGFSAGAARR